MDALTAFLVGDIGGAREVSSSTLEGYAHGVVKALLDKNIPLNDSILLTAKEANLNTEQVARVAELANREAYRQLHERHGSAQGNIEFVIADPNQIKALAVSSPLVASDSSEKLASRVPKYSGSKDYVLDTIPIEAIFGVNLEDLEQDEETIEEKYAKQYSVLESIREAKGEYDRLEPYFEQCMSNARVHFLEAVEQEGENPYEAVLVMKEAGLSSVLAAVLDGLGKCFEKHTPVLEVPKYAFMQEDHPLYLACLDLAEAEGILLQKKAEILEYACELPEAKKIQKSVDW